MSGHRPGRRRRRAQRTYRLLVRLYPAAYRRAFGEDMVRAFGDHYRDVVEGGGESRLRFWRAVLADARTSLLTEYAAAAGTWRRRSGAPKRQLRVSRRLRYRGRPGAPRRVQYHPRDGAPSRLGYRRQAGLSRWLRHRRRVRVARRLRGRPARVVFRGRHHRLVFRGGWAALIALVALIGLMLGVGAATGHFGIGALLAGLSVVAWLAHRTRLVRPLPAGPHGNGPAPPGGASVREPRRPLPTSPAGCATRPTPEQDDPGQAVAMI